MSQIIAPYKILHSAKSVVRNINTQICTDIMLAHAMTGHCRHIMVT